MASTRAQPKTKRTTRAPQPESDWLLGATAISKHTGLKPHQVYYAFSKGAFGDAVRKFGPKLLIASRTKLDALAQGGQQ